MAPTIGSDWRVELSRLLEGWDSASGKPITHAAMRCVDSFATVPCSDGGIQLEVHRDGFDVEIVIGPDGRLKSALICCEKGTA